MTLASCLTRNHLAKVFSETDEAYQVATRLMAATPEQLETHAVAMALRLNRAGEEFVQEMNAAERGTIDDN